MAQINDGGPAFPCALPEMGGGAIHGMTLRDYFAGQALAGILSDPEVGAPWDKVAAACYGVADAMLKARSLA